MGYIWLDDGLSLSYRKEQNEIRPFLQPVKNGLIPLSHYLVGGYNFVEGHGLERYCGHGRRLK